MKNNTMRIALVLCLCVIAFSAFDKDKPSSSTSLRNSNPEILANWAAIETSFGAHHEFSTGGTNSGDNLRIKFNAPIATPTNAANKLFIYGKDVSSVIEAHILDESGNEIQISSAGNILSSSLDSKDEDDMTSNSATHTATQQSIKAYIDSGTITMTNKTLTSPTLTSPVINTAISGTAFLDEDDMSSDSATKVASQQSVKAFGTWVPAVTGVGAGYAGEESITFPNGLIFKHGRVASVGANSQVDVTYGTAFPNAVISTAATFDSDTTTLDDPVGATRKSGSLLSILTLVNSSTATRGITWQAWGY